MTKTDDGRPVYDNGRPVDDDGDEVMPVNVMNEMAIVPRGVLSDDDMVRLPKLMRQVDI